MKNKDKVNKIQVELMEGVGFEFVSITPFNQAIWKIDCNQVITTAYLPIDLANTNIIILDLVCSASRCGIEEGKNQVAKGLEKLLNVKFAELKGDK